MPRRATPDPLARAVGTRIRQLREEQGLTLEKLAYESEVGSKGFLSDVEAGRALPSLATLQHLADRLEVDLLDLVTVPARSAREHLVDLTRGLTPGSARRLARDLAAQLRGKP